MLIIHQGSCVLKLISKLKVFCSIHFPLRKLGQKMQSLLSLHFRSRRQQGRHRAADRARDGGEVERVEAPQLVRDVAERKAAHQHAGHVQRLKQSLLTFRVGMGPTARRSPATGSS